MSKVIKHCKYCNTDKFEEDFGFHSNIRNDGTRSRKTKCKTCFSAYYKQYYSGHKEEYFSRSRKWREDNLERSRENTKRYRSEHKEAYDGHNKEWRKRNPEQVKKHVKRYYDGHKKEFHLNNKAWHKRNPGRANELSRTRYAKDPAHIIAYNTQRRALRFTNEYDEGITLGKLFIRDKGICGICNEICTRVNASHDHIQPLTKGGAHTWLNAQLAHISCNSRKGNKYDPPIFDKT